MFARALPIALPRPTPGLRARLRLWQHLWSSRRALARLDAAALDDIGLPASVARAEAARPFWKD